MRHLNLYLIFTFSCVFTSEAHLQQRMECGISIDHGLSIVSNRQQQISDLYSDIDISNRVSRPKGIWYSNSITLDTYWFDRKMIISLGFNSFRMKYVSDSVNSPVAAGLYYGQETVSSVFVFPKIEIAYRYPLNNRFGIQSRISFGAPEIMDRYKSKGVSYTEEGQTSWDNYNTIYGDGVWEFYVDKNALFLELGQQLSYEIDRWSFSTGFNYFFMRNWKLNGYHGLHFNVGCSVILGREISNNKTKPRPNIHRQGGV